MTVAGQQEHMPPEGAGTGRRHVSLDVFRGFTIALMIVVNTSGAGAEPFATLSHAKWIGLTLADLVFPAFLFAVGSSMSLGDTAKGTAGAYLWRVARRAAIMFLLGYLMYWFPFFHQAADGHWAFNPIGHTRIMGVLQRISLCYLVAAIAVRWLGTRGLAVLAAALLLGYWALLVLAVPAPEQFTPLGNLAAQIDRAVLGMDHMYAKGHGYDPEGLLGTLPAVANVLAGFLAGRYLRDRGSRPGTVYALIVAGVAALACGWAWSLVFPIAKRLWTSSFAVITIGVDLLFLAAVIAYVDLVRARAGVGFLQTFGRNPLAIYLFSELFVTALQLVRTPTGEGLYDWVGIHLFQHLVPGAAGALVCAVAYMLVCWLFGYLLDRNKILIKI